MNNSDEIDTNLTKCTCNTIVTPTGGLPQESWKQVLTQLTRSMYNSTAVCLPPPEHLIDASNTCEYCQQHQQKHSTFNVDLLSTKDISHYRQLRSESILFRIYRKVPLELDKINVLRIDKGVFIAQQTRSPLQQRLQSIDVPESIFDAFLNDTVPLPSEVPVSNFDFSVLTELITKTNDYDQQQSSSSYCLNNFIPYTYTVGLRYTSMNDHRKDYMIQGLIPLWCQVLLLNRIHSAQPPIQVNETRYGLIPFATDLPLTFHGLLDYRNGRSKMDDGDGSGFDDPEMLVWYERFAMDDAGHTTMGQASDYGNAYWGANRDDVLRKLVYCHVPMDLAQVVSDWNEWIKTM